MMNTTQKQFSLNRAASKRQFPVSLTVLSIKRASVLAAALLILARGMNLLAADAALPQRVLYIGHRGADFEPLLKRNFSQAQIVSRDELKPAAANGFDVVLLDWPQSEEARSERLGKSPLGTREAWGKPTVLLGSAGLNLAVVWKLKGGSG